MMMYGGATLWLLFIGGIFVLAWFGIVREREQARTSRAGWVYFIGTDDPNAPIKVGMTKRDPRNDRLPEIEAMSPTPLHVIYCFKSKDAAHDEVVLHRELDHFRHHGEWFDRNAVLALIDGLVNF